MAPKIIVHTLPIVRSRADRVVWALEELGLPYKIQTHASASPAFLKAPASMIALSAKAKTPIVEIDATKHTETGATVTHLLSEYWTPSCGLEHPLSPSAGASRFWSHFAEGSIMSYVHPAIRISSIAKMLTTPRAGDSEAAAARKEALKPGVDALMEVSTENAYRNTNQALAEAEEFLAQNGEWFSGGSEPGVGDFMMLVPLYVMAGYPASKQPYVLGPATRAWVERVKARPAFQRAIKRMDEALAPELNKSKTPQPMIKGRL